MSADISIVGLQEAQRWNARAIANMHPDGTFGRLVQSVVVSLLRTEIAETHVDTGALRASERMEVRDLWGRTYLDPEAYNPRSLALTSVYGVFEDARGAPHDFGYYTAEEAGPEIVLQALEVFGPTLQ